MLFLLIWVVVLFVIWGDLLLLYTKKFVFHIPTTLLSQVDASVGGKLAVDLDGLKNQIGVFRNPELVLIVPKFLKTLSERHWLSGMAEAYKHALISDKDYWHF